MHPVLGEIGPVVVRSYAVFVVLAFVVAGLIRRSEVERLGYDGHPQHVWVGVGGLVGAIVGAKVGILLFQPFDDWQAMLARVFDLDFTGKTVLGGIAGGYLGVELTKKLVGVTFSTGDGFAVAVPVGQALGRIGCLLEGCCWGQPTDVAWAIPLRHASRHPTQLYEAVLCLLLAAALWSLRGWGRPAGHLFRVYLIGYAAIRFVLDPLRADGAMHVGPLTAVQWACLLTIGVFGVLLVQRRT